MSHTSGFEKKKNVARTQGCIMYREVKLKVCVNVGSWALIFEIWLIWKESSIPCKATVLEVKVSSASCKYDGTELAMWCGRAVVGPGVVIHWTRSANTHSQRRLIWNLTFSHAYYDELRKCTQKSSAEFPTEKYASWTITQHINLASISKFGYSWVTFVLMSRSRQKDFANFGITSVKATKFYLTLAM